MGTADWEHSAPTAQLLARARLLRGHDVVHGGLNQDGRLLVVQRDALMAAPDGRHEPGRFRSGSGRRRRRRCCCCGCCRPVPGVVGARNNGGQILPVGRFQLDGREGGPKRRSSRTAGRSVASRPVKLSDVGRVVIRRS